MEFDSIMMEYITRRGWKVEGGQILLTSDQLRKAHPGRSIRDSRIRTLTIPGIHGLTLIFEGKHFMEV